MKQLLIALTAGAVLALAGCGDDDSGSDELTKDEYIEQADSICKKTGERIDQAEDDFADPEAPTEAEIEQAMTEIVVPEYRDQLEELRDLEPPSEDADTLDEMLDNLETGIDSLEEDWRQADQAAFNRANEIAADYGFEECGD